MKLVSATQTAADLMAQQKIVCASDVTSYGTAAGLVMEPMPPGNIQVAFDMVKINPITFAATSDWNQQVNGAAAINAIGPGLVTAAGLNTNGSTETIVARATYTYTSPFTYLLNKTYTFTETAFAQPRYVSFLPAPTC
jgi:hypothetical protein